MGAIPAFGVVCRHERLEWLTPILRRWGHLIDDYCESHRGDTPYFYSEWTNVGMLAGAAWGPGSGALQEYACRRTGGDGDSGRSGRADLYLYDQNNSAILEAKQLWGHAKLDSAQVNGCFRAGNAQAVSNRDSDMAVAAVFLTVKVKKTIDPVADGRAVDAASAAALRAMENAAAHAWAWAFPSSKRMFAETERASDTMYYWPGVVLGVRLAHANFGRGK
ncbi:hypothetical protein [Magnetospirillum sulfuroxidans]|uniref:Uncharacterized protein n=1 Tax=Magnetospirillum sulfuroxidans TaxID=611300 RepID=A0ABS5IF03_9PROT|nr:hypothetical protein [Magnetospirillum sulfuroxidans]MBR9972353.1 hypothetical protein [Magnetospirillum sulfuroxidans]